MNYLPKIIHHTKHHKNSPHTTDKVRYKTYLNHDKIRLVSYINKKIKISPGTNIISGDTH